MAEPQEDIIIIEDDDAAKLHDDEDSSQDDEENLKKIIIIGGIAISIVLIALIIAILVVKSSKKEERVSIKFIEKRLSEQKIKPIEPSKLEAMIAKANYLYTTGSKQDALHLYERIALYSKAISEYNLGVARLKNKQYKLALESFENAIQNNEKRCVSAINAAVCSLHLKNHNDFRYYIDLAYAYLPNEIDSPLYSYYYTLINYYNNNYLESLSALKNFTSKDYPKSQRYLNAKINALFGNNLKAIESMENNFLNQDDFSIALLYSRIGDYTLAIEHFKEALKENIQPAKTQLALGLIELKAGRLKEGSRDIKNVTDMFPKEVYKSYPIKVKLKESIFDSKKAQKYYRYRINKSKNLTYQKIFYFAPYKIFNANRTINYIRKGNANVFIDNISSAEKYLKKSASSSKVNYGIAKAIKKALEFRIRTANSELQKLAKLHPKHSILQYDLALTYAQMGDMQSAYNHFIRSYHLDAKNYLSGIFTIMTSQLIHKESSKFKSILTDALNNENDSEKINLYKTLLKISKNDYLSAIDWLDNHYKQRPLYLALDIIISTRLNKMNVAKKDAKKLTSLLPHDILPHIMYADSYFYDLKETEYAKKLLNYFKVQNLSFADLYYGPYISRYLYIQENLITGKLYFLRTQLKNILETTKEYKEEIVASLALASLYDKAYEESYTLYNQLIDEFKIRDANTLFLGSVASTAANHHANAIALLELSKMKNTNFFESRYALGLLYLELQNNEGATIQLSRIKEKGFIPQYYDFEIDTDKLLFKKQHPKE